MTTLQPVHCHVELENTYCGDWPSGHDGGAATHWTGPALSDDDPVELPGVGEVTATWPALQLASPQDTVIADGGASLVGEGVAEWVPGTLPERASDPDTTLLLPHAVEKRFE